MIRNIAVYSALFANFGISITKFIAAAITGSSAMISEGIHSLVDTGNEILLLYGIHKSKKEASEKRPFGYAKELYFWSFIVSILIFAVGGGISFYEGVIHLRHPQPMKDVKWNYIVLGIAFLLDGFSFVTAVRAFNVERGSQSFWSAVKRSKNPTTFVVLFEDSADLLGLSVAMAGVYFGHKYNNPYFDGAASIIIGCILTCISLLLARESRSLLMGESVDQEILDSVTFISESDGMVKKVFKPLSMFLGPEEIIMVIPVVFQNTLNTGEINEAIKRLKEKIREKFPDIRQIFIEPRTLEDQS